MLPVNLDVGHDALLATPKVASTGVATRMLHMVWVWIMRIEIASRDVDAE